MHLDVKDLQKFYEHNPLGRVVRRRLSERLLEFWPNSGGETLIGYGFALPILESFLEQNPNSLALMPAPQGVLRWPQKSPNRAVLCQETRWPFGAGQIERLIILHGLETCERPALLLEECRRVLTEDGEAVFIVPNRVGLWARSDHTPFGFGRPYSGGQLDYFLQSAGFEIIARKGALFMPPFQRKLAYGLGYVVRFVGQRMPFVFPSGVWIVRVRRQVIALNRPPQARKRAKSMLTLPGAKPRPVLNRNAKKGTRLL